MKILLYTAIFGGYDKPKPICKQNNPNVEWGLATDNEETQRLAIELGYKVEFPQAMSEYNFTKATEGLDNRMKGRYYKTHPTAIASWFDLYIWVDGSAVIKSPDFVDMVVSQIGNYPLMIFRHPEDRDCIYQEATYASPMPKYQGKGLIEKAGEYKKDGMPEHFGLWACGLIASRPKDETMRFMQRWWTEQKLGCYHDQISLPYLLWKTGQPIKTLELDQYNNEFIEFRMDQHISLL